MKKFYFTFCLDHPKYANTICCVEAENYSAARDVFVAKFGLRWAFQYDETQYEQMTHHEWFIRKQVKTININDLPYEDPTPVG